MRSRKTGSDISGVPAKQEEWHREPVQQRISMAGKQQIDISQLPVQQLSSLSQQFGEVGWNL